MTASGPFALGPALTGASARRTVPRSAIPPVVPPTAGTLSTAGTGSSSVRPSLKKEKEVEQPSLEEIRDDDDSYSEQDDGVEIIDMENVHQMDWMAPETLRKERNQAVRKTLRRKAQSPSKDVKGKNKGK